jgi:hypothetical protein
MGNTMASLTVSEARRRESLEEKIRDHVIEGRRHHFLIGECLDAILTEKLYRSDHDSFDAYCESVWRISGSVGRKAANTYRVAVTLQKAEMEAPEVYWSILTGLQTSHAQRLTQLPEQLQPVAWSEAKESTETPTVKALEAVVEKYKNWEGERQSMTSEEESEYNAQIEAETLQAWKAGKVQEVAEVLAKKLRAMRRHVPSSLAEEFKATLDAIEGAAEKADLAFARIAP